MAARLCNRCRRSLPVHQFGPRGKQGGRKRICRKCDSDYMRRLRAASPEMRAKGRAAHAKLRKGLKERIDDLKRTTPCADCHQFHPHWRMQFDHVRGEKVDHLSALIHNGATRMVEDEIKKCELVCANCHADRTHRRLHDGKSAEARAKSDAVMVASGV